MKNFWLTLVIAAAVCGAAFAIGYKSGGDPELSRAASEGDAMAWLRAEFKLNDAQFAAVKKTHEDYSVVCGEHCAAIMAAKSRGAPAGDVVANVTVNLSLTHTFNSDLIITLISPTGSRVVLANRVGGSSANFTNTTFDDAASAANGDDEMTA